MISQNIAYPSGQTIKRCAGNYTFDIVFGYILIQIGIPFCQMFNKNFIRYTYSALDIIKLG